MLIYYAYMNYVPRYTSQPLPTKPWNNPEPRDVPRIIPSSGGIPTTAFYSMELMPIETGEIVFVECKWKDVSYRSEEENLSDL